VVDFSPYDNEHQAREFLTHYADQVGGPKLGIAFCDGHYAYKLRLPQEPDRIWMLVRAREVPSAPPRPAAGPPLGSRSWYERIRDFVVGAYFQRAELDDEFYDAVIHSPPPLPLALAGDIAGIVIFAVVIVSLAPVVIAGGGVGGALGGLGLLSATVSGAGSAVAFVNDARVYYHRLDGNDDEADRIENDPDIQKIQFWATIATLPDFGVGSGKALLQAMTEINRAKRLQEAAISATRRIPDSGTASAARLTAKMTSKIQRQYSRIHDIHTHIRFLAAQQAASSAATAYSLLALLPPAEDQTPKRAQRNVTLEIFFAGDLKFEDAGC